MVTTARSARKSRYGPRYPRTYSGGQVAGTTRMPASQAIGGNEAPLPSRMRSPGSRSAASATAASTLLANGAPARPPPARRAPIVVTPVVSASSR